MNILTFDIEEWYLEKVYHGDHAFKYELFDKYLGVILDKLEVRNKKATFFCVGGLATEFPDVLRKIADKGHEIGCHSNTHQWLSKMSQAEALEDTRIAVDSLEQCIGKKIVSYRAPAFSIGEKNKWAFEMLSECGIERDASVFPTYRDFGGFPQFKEQLPALVNYQGITIKEFPIPTTKMLGKELAYSGGGYFRFFPLWMIKSRMKGSKYNMCYFHIADLMNTTSHFQSREEYEDYFHEPGTLLNRSKRFIKGNLGKKGALNKMSSLLNTMSFIDLNTADELIDWSNTKQINL